jgi:hypothetical protein
MDLSLIHCVTHLSGDTMKNIIGIYTSPRGWVGDGFPVRTLFSYDNLGKHISPFLLLDHAGPANSPRPPSAAAWASTRTVVSKP